MKFLFLKKKLCNLARSSIKFIFNFNFENHLLLTVWVYNKTIAFEKEIRMKEWKHKKYMYYVAMCINDKIKFNIHSVHNVYNYTIKVYTIKV